MAVERSGNCQEIFAAVMIILAALVSLFRFNLLLWAGWTSPQQPQKPQTNVGKKGLRGNKAIMHFWFINSVLACKRSAGKCENSGEPDQEMRDAFFALILRIKFQS